MACSRHAAFRTKDFGFRISDFGFRVCDSPIEGHQLPPVDLFAARERYARLAKSRLAKRPCRGFKV
jgi:hypothetical protein